MTTLIANRAARRIRKLLTAADLAALPSESGVRRRQVRAARWKSGDHGAARETHSSVQTRIVNLLASRSRRHGKVLADVGVILRRNPDRVVAPDVAFVNSALLPLRKSPEDYLETIPELVIEVRSKNDRPTSLPRKAQAYLQAGVRAVWIVEPVARTVTVYQARHTHSFASLTL